MDDERAARLLAASDGECGYDHTGGAVLLAAPMASLLIGALLAHLSSRFCPWLPYTPTLALIGILVAYIALEQGECSHMRGSITSWVDINGHALLFLFLPPLLFADTMHMDWELAKTSLLQCMLLAGPGVLLGSGLHMIYGSYMLPYDWDLLLSLGFGTVQAATDPVAVVSLLSSLGAPVTLTMIISGESLLNDGTAVRALQLLSHTHTHAHTHTSQLSHLHPQIVVWNVAFYTYLGESEGNPLVYAIKLIFGGLGIGIAFWLATLFWMSRLNRRHGHTDGTIQVALTLILTLTLTPTLTLTLTLSLSLTLTLTRWR